MLFANMNFGQMEVAVILLIVCPISLVLLLAKGSPTCTSCGGILPPMASRGKPRAWCRCQNGDAESTAKSGS
jgi:hypothetical protein